MIWPFTKRYKGVSPEMAAIFERYHQFFSDDAKQLEQYPESLKIRMLAGADVDKIEGSCGLFGRTITNPIPVNGPIGEILYLSSLQLNSQRLIFHRLGGRDNIDIYECVTTDGGVWDILFLDMYHPRKSRIAPEGYRIETSSLLSGTNRIVSDFPALAYEEILRQSERLFGMSFADPKIRIAIEKNKFRRPAEHLANLLKIGTNF